MKMRVLGLALALTACSSPTAVEVPAPAETQSYTYTGTWDGVIVDGPEKSLRVQLVITDKQIDGVWYFHHHTAYQDTVFVRRMHGHINASGTAEHGDYFNAHLELFAPVLSNETGAFPGLRFAGWVEPDDLDTLHFMRYGNILDAFYGAGSVLPNTTEVSPLRRIDS